MKKLNFPRGSFVLIHARQQVWSIFFFFNFQTETSLSTTMFLCCGLFQMCMGCENCLWLNAEGLAEGLNGLLGLNS